MAKILIDISSDNFPIFYNTEADTIIYKDNEVSASLIIKAYRSRKDRVHIIDKLYMYNSNGLISFGCLNLTKNKVEQLIKTIKLKSDATNSTNQKN